MKIKTKDLISRITESVRAEYQKKHLEKRVVKMNQENDVIQTENINDIIKNLEKRAAEIKQELESLKSKGGIISEFLKNDVMNNEPIYNSTQITPQTPNTQSVFQSQSGGSDKQESVFDCRPGDIIILSFRDVSIKLKKQMDDLFKVIDGTQSEKLNDGDLIKITGDGNLKVGQKYLFQVLRPTESPYESNELAGWKIMKNR